MEESNGRFIYWTRLEHEQWNMCIAATAQGLCYVGSQNKGFEELENWAKKRLPIYDLVENAENMKSYKDELIDYVSGKRKNFSEPVDLHGTPFQKEVWKALQEIPYGQTVSYTDIAVRVQKPGSVRAVGTAIGANPVLITVPCHRVLAKSGKLAGYRGGLEMKEQLLALELTKEISK
ncbi:methylated-DNA--[protein]-cysteine S-methyltransferase [Paenisporosarcina macmurdoensis]|uniref:Methylated-DNA--[protein]-cysteine S-methyltransferase n=1 Tax=Paenisporosarcina macmurdoensis TaxID=212659 RepID=A0ABW1L9E8_9BACL